MISSAWLLSLAVYLLGCGAYDYDACECFEVSLTNPPTVDNYGNICYNYFICQADHAPEECPQLNHVTLDRGDISTCDSGGWRFIRNYIVSDGYSLYNGGNVKGIRFNMQFNQVEYEICFDASYVSGTQTSGSVLYTDLDGVQTECSVSNVLPGFCAPSPTPSPTWPTPSPTWPTPSPTWPTPQPTWPTPYPTTKSPTPKPTTKKPTPWPTKKPTPWPTKKPTPWPTVKYSSSGSKSKSKSGSSDKKKSGSSSGKKKKSGSSSGKKKSSSGSKKSKKSGSSSGNAAYAWAAPLDAQDHGAVKNEPNQPIAVEPFQPWGFYLIVVLISAAVQLTGCAAFYMCFLRKKILVDAKPLTSGYAISRKVADDSDAEIEVE